MTLSRVILGLINNGKIILLGMLFAASWHDFYAS